jgi:hypothetical protein
MSWATKRATADAKRSLRELGDQLAGRSAKPPVEVQRPIAFATLTAPRPLRFGLKNFLLAETAHRMVTAIVDQLPRTGRVIITVPTHAEVTRKRGGQLRVEEKQPMRAAYDALVSFPDVDRYIRRCPMCNAFFLARRLNQKCDTKKCNAKRRSDEYRSKEEQYGVNEQVKKARREGRIWSTFRRSRSGDRSIKAISLNQSIT